MSRRNEDRQQAVGEDAQASGAQGYGAEVVAAGDPGARVAHGRAGRRPGAIPFVAAQGGAFADAAVPDRAGSRHAPRQRERVCLPHRVLTGGWIQPPGRRRIRYAGAVAQSPHVGAPFHSQRGVDDGSGRVRRPGARGCGRAGWQSPRPSTPGSPSRSGVPSARVTACGSTEVTVVDVRISTPWRRSCTWLRTQRAGAAPPRGSSDLPPTRTHRCGTPRRAG